MAEWVHCHTSAWIQMPTVGGVAWCILQQMRWGNWWMRTLEKLLACLSQIHTTRPKRLLSCVGDAFLFSSLHARSACCCPQHQARQSAASEASGPGFGTVRAGLWASGCRLPSTQAGSAAYLVAGAQGIVAVCHHFPVQEADECVLRAAHGRSGRREENLQARHGYLRLLWGRKQRRGLCRKPLRLGEAGPRAAATPPDAVPSLSVLSTPTRKRGNAETQKPTPEILADFVSAPDWKHLHRTRRFR